MKRLSIIIVLCALCLTLTNAQVLGSKPMFINVNGNSYQTYDLLSDSLKNFFRASTELFKNQIKQIIDSECKQQTDYYPLNIRYHAFPKELKNLNYSSDVDGVWISFVIDSLRIHWDQRFANIVCWPCTTICKLESPVKDVPGSITVKAKINLVQDIKFYRLTLENISADVSNFKFRNDDDRVHLIPNL